MTLFPLPLNPQTVEGSARKDLTFILTFWKCKSSDDHGNVPAQSWRAALGFCRIFGCLLRKPDHGSVSRWACRQGKIPLGGEKPENQVPVKPWGFYLVSWQMELPGFSCLFFCHHSTLNWAQRLADVHRGPWMHYWDLAHWWGLAHWWPLRRAVGLSTVLLPLRLATPAF